MRQNNTANKERQLLQALAGGLESARKKIYRRYRDELLDHVLTRMLTKETSDELVKKVFGDLFNRPALLGPFNSMRELTFFLWRAADQHIAEHKAYLEREINYFPWPLSVGFVRICHQAVQGLPPKCRTVFKLRQLDGHSVHTVARRLKLPASEVRSRYADAVIHMRQYYIRSNILFGIDAKKHENDFSDKRYARCAKTPL